MCAPWLTRDYSETVLAVRWAEHLNRAVAPSASNVHTAYHVSPSLDENSRSGSPIGDYHLQASLLGMTLGNRSELLAANTIAFMAVAHCPTSLRHHQLEDLIRSLILLLDTSVVHDTMAYAEHEIGRAHV